VPFLSLLHDLELVTLREPLLALVAVDTVAECNPGTALASA
jgi:hypothetical protein